jgi:hypothetical protein
MSLYIECKADEALVLALGIPKREVEHAANRAGVCAQLARHNNVTGMVDEDPDSVPQSYMRSLPQESWEHSIRVLRDEERGNWLIALSPRLEEWLVQTAKGVSLKMTDFGFESDNGVQLHGEINHRLGSLVQLVEALLKNKSQRILRLQSLLRQGK